MTTGPVTGWQTSDAVPADMAIVLQTARRLLAHSSEVYEYGLVAVTWTLLALEAGLRVCLDVQDQNEELGTLLSLAKQRGLITKDEHKVLDGARTLRNQIVHGALVPSFAPHTAVDMVSAIHDAIVDLYTRAAQGSTANGPAVSQP